MYEQPPARRRIGPALIAWLVLIGGGVGTGSYFVARELLPASSPAHAGTAPGGSGTGTNPAKVSVGEAGRTCPALTAQAVEAAGLDDKLTLLRYVDATMTGGTPAEAWICRNAQGELFYQGHRKSGPFTAATGTDTILLGDGIRGEVDRDGSTGYVATNPLNPDDPHDQARTEYHVSETSFYFVVEPGGQKNEYTITATAP